MPSLANYSKDERVVILMPTQKDGERTQQALSAAGIGSELCGGVTDLCAKICEGAGTALLTEEILERDKAGCVLSAVRGLPTWSDFPLILLARENVSPMRPKLRESLNISLVERPVRMRSLVSVVRAALRSRRQQYAVRDLLVQHEQQATDLRSKDERLRFALTAGRLGSWELNLATCELDCSDICKANFGRPVDQAFTYDELFAVIHPDDRKRVEQAFADSLHTGGDYDVEYRCVWPDSSVHWVLVRGRVTARENDSPTRMSGVSLDITDAKAAETQLRDADRRKDEFLALLAHELRNPLAPLRNAVGIIRMADGDHELVRETGDLMERQLSHMVRLIDDLLDVSRISRDKLELRRTRVGLADVVASAVETMRPLIAAAGHQLAVTLPAEPIYLDADPTRLSQVFANLLSNSAKYTPRGGRIQLSAERTNGEVAVAVRDNGIGIPQDALPTIFDMFSQVDRTLERTTGGLGIGLALVQGLVRMHFGSVTAESAGPDQGSAFTVRLPVVEAPAEKQSGTNGAGAARTNRRVLVVDDNRDSAKTMALMLKMLGDETHTAHDGISAIEEAERFRPEVILMDVGMPRLNGYEATRRIRREPWGGDIVIIALTGWGQDADRIASREAGCDGHLVKPVDFGDLEKLLGDVTQKS